jgi:hypothetical protein
MKAWTVDELDRIGGSDEIELASKRADGSARSYLPIWVVRVGDELFIRSYLGLDGAWFRAVLRNPEVRIRFAGTEREAGVERPEHPDHAAVDQAYRTKYGRTSSAYVDPMIGAAATATTLRLVPR